MIPNKRNFAEGMHGAWCNARTFPMRCKYCGDSVYYFACDHGEKVFFDQLGAPWPEHGCIGYLKAVSAQDVIETSPVKKKTTRRAGIGGKIDKKYADKLIQAQARRHEPEIVRGDPYRGATAHEEGIIREIFQGVDVFKKLKVVPNSIGATLLGELGKGDYAQVTIHTGALAGEDHFSYTFFVPQALLRRASVGVGDFVSVRLRALTVLGDKNVWLCERLAGVFG